MNLPPNLKLHLSLWLGILSILFATNCSKNKNNQEEPELDYRTRIRLKQYNIQGRNLYQSYCSNCHQPDGSGLGQLYPPLKNSDYMIDSLARTVCLIKYGQKGSIIVNGTEYNQEMPANPDLSNLEIAEIVTFIYNEFGGQRELIDVKEVEKLIGKCK